MEYCSPDAISGYSLGTLSALSNFPNADNSIQRSSSGDAENVGTSFGVSSQVDLGETGGVATWRPAYGVSCS